MMDVAMGATTVAALALTFAARHRPPFPVDVAITRAVQNLPGPWIAGLLSGLSTIGFPPLVDVVYGLIAIGIFATGRRREGVAAALVAGGGAALNFIFKEIAVRPRPSVDLVRVARDVPGSSFPAGHVLNATAFLGFLTYLAWKEMRPSWRRTGIVALLAIAIAGMGLARIYSGEHWASDVLGGYLLGGIWLYAGARGYEALINWWS
jgi:membrane-associated phospholipid phosphatase